MNNGFPVRKNLRARNFDYNNPGSYFITFCTYRKENTLSTVIESDDTYRDVELTSRGRIAERVIEDLPSRLMTRIDHFVIMPNHVHMIITVLESCDDSEQDQKSRNDSEKNRSVVSKAVGYVKMNASKMIRESEGDVQVWQRGFYDHIIRSADEYYEIAKYIADNPAKWRSDSLYSL